MLALRPDIVEAVWQAVAGHLPEREEKAHPLGCHRGAYRTATASRRSCSASSPGAAGTSQAALAKAGRRRFDDGATNGSWPGSSRASSPRRCMPMTE